LTEEEKTILRPIAHTTKRAMEQQERIGRLEAENQPTDAAVELLCALLDSMRVQQQRLEALRSPVNLRILQTETPPADVARTNLPTILMGDRRRPRSPASASFSR